MSALEHFRAKWIPARVKKMRKNKKLEPGSDSIRTGKALGRGRRGRMKHHRKAVHTAAQAGRLRPIVEHVAEMTAATTTVDFGPDHAEGAVLMFADGVVE